MPASPPNVVRGIVRIARGRASGLTHFPATVQGFLASLAPLIAFPLVGSLLSLLHGAGWRALDDFLATLCALLAPPVLSFEFARLWHRQGNWLLYATAFNWCQWLLPVIASVLLVLLSIAEPLGLSDAAATALLVIGLGGYGLWLHWFLARHALELSPTRATLLVICVNAGTVLLALGPRFLALQRL